MNIRYVKEISFLETIAGFSFEPKATAKELLPDDKPTKYWLGIFIFCLLIVLGPILWAAQAQGMQYAQLMRLRAFSFLVVFWILGFALAQALLFKIILLGTSFAKLFAIGFYALSPVTFIAFVTWTTNYIARGNFSLAAPILTGLPEFGDWLIFYMPYVALFGCLLIFCTVWGCLRALEVDIVFTAIFAFLSLALVYASYLAAESFVIKLIPEVSFEFMASLKAVLGF